MLMTAAIAFLGFIVLASLGFVFTSGPSASPVLTKRTAAIGMRQVTRAKRQKGAAKTPEERRKQITEQLKESEKRERKKRLTLRARMLYAGLAPNVTQFMIYSAILGADEEEPWTPMALDAADAWADAWALDEDAADALRVCVECAVLGLLGCGLADRRLTDVLYDPFAASVPVNELLLRARLGEP